MARPSYVERYYAAKYDLIWAEPTKKAFYKKLADEALQAVGHIHGEKDLAAIQSALRSDFGKWAQEKGLPRASQP